MNRGVSLTNLAPHVKSTSCVLAASVEIENRVDRAAAHGAKRCPAAAEHDAILFGTVRAASFVVGAFKCADSSGIRPTRQQACDLEIGCAHQRVDLGLGPPGTPKRQPPLL